MSVLRCKVTGNPCGTDTWPKSLYDGSLIDCQCSQCQRWLGRREGCSLPHLLCCDRSCVYYSVLGSVPCAVCRAKAAGKREGIEAAAKRVEELLMQPIRLIPMTPTKEKETRDDMRHGMQKALAVVRALLQTEARVETGEGKQ